MTIFFAKFSRDAIAERFLQAPRESAPLARLG